MRKLGTVIGEMSNIAYRSPLDAGPIRRARWTRWLAHTAHVAALALGFCLVSTHLHAESATSGWRQTVSPPPITHDQGERKAEDELDRH